MDYFKYNESKFCYMYDKGVGYVVGEILINFVYCFDKIIIELKWIFGDIKLILMKWMFVILSSLSYEMIVCVVFFFILRYIMVFFLLIGLDVCVNLMKNGKSFF